MKKLFLSALLALLAVGGASAQDGIRRTWDFTKGFKQTTIDNLTAAGWTVEGAGSIQCAGRSEGPLTYKIDGVDWTVPETTGLTFHQTAAKHIVFAYDRSGFIGRQFLWLNGNKAQDAITIDRVPAGENVTIQFESHDTKTDRGFKVVSGNFADAAGNTTFTSHNEITTVELINGESTESSLKIQATNGFHIYSIVIGAGDPVVAQKVAYLYSGETDGILPILQAREQTEVTPIDVASTTVTAEQLIDYNTVVVSASIPATNAAVATLKEAMPFVPVLNLNASLYAAWGYGEAVDVAEAVGIVANAKSSLLTNVAVSSEDGIDFVELAGSALKGVKLGSYFQADEVPFTEFKEGDEERVPLAHIHNASHNAYIYLPYAPDASEKLVQIIGNALDVLSASKSAITQAPMPGVKLEYKNLNTNITLVPSNTLVAPHVYYTLDGSEPTAASTEYTGVINVTKAVTLKAVAIGEGYLLSDVNTTEVAIMEQPKTPVITSKYEDGKTTVTIDVDNSDLAVYYNTDGSTEIAKSSVYTEPLEFAGPTDLYAFAVAGGAVWSELANARIVIKNAHVAVDIVGHFGTNDGWTKEGSTTAIANNGSFFTDNMNTATSMYDTTVEPVKVKDEETGDEIEIYPEVSWMSLNEPGENPEWMAMSKGEVILFQNNKPSNSNVGDDSGVNPVDITDIDTLFTATNYNLQFYTPYAGEPTNACIQSKNKYAGPFDVVVISCMPGGQASVQVSADGENWTTLGDAIAKTGKSRAWKKYTRIYEGNDEVYVRVARTDNESSTKGGPKIYDIYVAKTAEKSQQLINLFNEEFANAAAGIEELAAPAVKAAAGIYNVSGVRQASLQRGVNIVVAADGSVKKVVVK